jgi:molecular chaperone Hsp33
MLVSALNEVQDISIKAISCKAILNDYIKRFNLSTQAAIPFGELITCGLLLGSNMKGEENLQISFVGTQDSLMKRMMVIVNGSLKVKGTVGNTALQIEDGIRSLSTEELFGEGGQIQVVKNHPTWKQPVQSVIGMHGSTIPLNLGIYVTQSEQRRGAFLADVTLSENRCTSATALFIECLPGCPDETVEKVIENVNQISKKRLSSYFLEKEEGNNDDESVLSSIIDDCLKGMGNQGVHWSRCPEFECNCGMEKIWRTLTLLPKKDIFEILVDKKGVEVRRFVNKCLF